MTVEFGAQLTGQSIAHEILHALTLASTHAIDATTNSNSSGHAPDKDGDAGNDNIMAPSNRRTGTTIKPKQKKKIEDDGYLKKWGKQIKKESKAHTGEKKDLQKGTAQDDVNDAVSPHTDLSRIGMGSEVGNPIIGGVISLAGLVPPDEPVDATYVLNFETDISFDGPEQMLVIDVWGDQSIDPLLDVQGHLIDLAGGGEFIPVPVNLTTGIRAVDLDIPAEPVELQLEFQLEKFLLTGDSEPGLISIVAQSFDNLLIDEIAGPDELQFWFDGRWFVTQPDLLLGKGQALPGDTIPIEIVGLSVASSFDLFIDETLLFSELTDNSGNFMGDFVLPEVEPSDFFFVTAIDQFGTSAFNVIHLSQIDGDLDGDGDVDGNDFLLWQRHFPFLDGTAGNSSGDANGDGNVDGNDFLVWQRNFPFPATLSPVPEPNSLMMLAIGGLVLLRRHRRVICS